VYRVTTIAFLASLVTSLKLFKYFYTSIIFLPKYSKFNFHYVNCSIKIFQVVWTSLFRGHYGRNRVVKILIYFLGFTIGPLQKENQSSKIRELMSSRESHIHTVYLHQKIDEYADFRSNISNTSRRTSSDIQTPRGVEIARRSRAILTNLEVFWNRRKSYLRVFQRTSQTILYFSRKSRWDLA